jgi:hypothetical protein
MATNPGKPSKPTSYSKHNNLGTSVYLCMLRMLSMLSALLVSNQLHVKMLTWSVFRPSGKLSFAKPPVRFGRLERSD